LKRQKKKGGKLPVDLVKLAKIAISPALGKGLAEFEVAFNIPQNTGTELGRAAAKAPNRNPRSHAFRSSSLKGEDGERH
jgi:hypothetical protein